MVDGKNTLGVDDDREPVVKMTLFVFECDRGFEFDEVRGLFELELAKGFPWLPTKEGVLGLPVRGRCSGVGDDRGDNAPPLTTDLRFPTS